MIFSVHLASFVHQNFIIVFLLLLLNRGYHVRTLRISVQLFLELFIEVFDEILIRLFQRTWNDSWICLGILRRLLRMEWEWLNLFKLLSYEIRLCTDQSSRNFVIEYFEAELSSLSHLEFLIVHSKFNFFPLPGLNSIRNNFYHSIIFFSLLNSSDTLNFSLPRFHGAYISLVGFHIQLIPRVMPGGCLL